MPRREGSGRKKLDDGIIFTEVREGATAQRGGYWTSNCTLLR